MESVGATVQSNEKVFDIGVALYSLMVVGYVILMQASILLGAIAIVIPITAYRAVKQEQYNHGLAITLGGIVAISGILLDPRITISLLLGLFVYIAVMLYHER